MASFVEREPRPLTKRQQDQFDKLFRSLDRWVELERPYDYAAGPVEDGHFQGDVRSRRIEFIMNDVIYDVILTCRRET
jgi:hypothetical protein